MITIHPSVEELQAFAMCQGDFATIEEHLATCEECWRVVEAAQAELHIVHVLQTLPTDLLGEGSARRFPAELQGHPRYRLLEFIGEGGMGQVWKSRHRLLDRIVAIKIIRPGLVRDADRLARFRREAQAVARLSHPHIVAAHDADEASGLHFLVMEYVQGDNLHRVVQSRGPMPVGEACGYIRQAALGLAHAHMAGVVHRDITAGNLLLTPDGLVKVTDFGLSVLRGEARPANLTDPDLAMGTPDGTAPEQLRDAATVDARADIYALGCVLYYLLTGRPPFEGSNAEKAAGHLDREPTPVSQLRPDMPLPLSAVVSKMMAKRLEDRFQTATEVADALRPFADAKPQPTAGRPRWDGSLAVAGFVALLIGLAVAAWVVWHTGWPQSRNETTSTTPSLTEPVGVPPSTTNSRPVGIPVLKPRRLFESHATPVLAVALSSDRRQALSVSRDSHVRIWQLDGDKHRAHLVLEPPEIVMSAAFSPDGRLVLTITGGQAVRLREVDSGRDVWRKVWEGRTAVAVFSPDGQEIVAGGSDGKVRRYSAADGRETTAWDAHKSFVVDLAWSPGGRRLLTTANDGEACLWEEGKELLRFRLKPDCLMRRAGFVGEDQILCGEAGKEDRFTLRELKSGSVVRDILGHSQELTCVAVSPDSRRALTGSYDKEVRLWDIATGKQVADLRGHAAPVLCVRFADDRTALSGGLDGAVCLWNLEGAREP